MTRLLILCLCLSPPMAAAFGQQEATRRGKTVAQWTRQLADRDIRARWYATYALGQIGPDAAAAVEPLCALLEDKRENEYVRGGAVWALGRIGPAARSAVPLLVESLTSRHVSVRRNAPTALGALAEAAKPAIPPLLQLLDDPDTTVRVNAAAALWRINRHPRAAAALVQISRRHKGPDAFQATVALGRVAAESEMAITALVAALRHGDGDVRRGAVRALGEVGPAAAPALQRALRDADAEVRRGAAEALGRIGPGSISQLVAALEDDNPAVCCAAARALGRLGASAAAAEPALIEAVNDPKQEVREAAARALTRIRSAVKQPPAEK